MRAGEPAARIVGCHDDAFALRASAADTKHLLLPSRHRAIVLERYGRSFDAKKIDLLIRDIGRRRSADRARATRLRRRVFLPRTSVIELCQDKYALAMVPAARGVPTPVTHAVRRLADIPDSSGVWRPRDRYGAGSDLGRGPRRPPGGDAGAGAELIAYWERMRGVRAAEFTLSEYLPGRDFSCQSLWHEGILVLTKTFERLVPFDGEPGTSSVAALAKTVNEPRVAAVCEVAGAP